MYRSVCDKKSAIFEENLFSIHKNENSILLTNVIIYLNVY